MAAQPGSSAGLHQTQLQTRSRVDSPFQLAPVRMLENSQGEGFTTTVLPVMVDGRSLFAAIANGKFHGVIPDC